MEHQRLEWLVAWLCPPNLTQRAVTRKNLLWKEEVVTSESCDTRSIHTTPCRTSDLLRFFRKSLRITHQPGAQQLQCTTAMGDSILGFLESWLSCLKLWNNLLTQVTIRLTV